MTSAAFHRLLNDFYRDGDRKTVRQLLTCFGYDVAFNSRSNKWDNLKENIVSYLASTNDSSEHIVNYNNVSTRLEHLAIRKDKAAEFLVEFQK